MQSFTAQEIRDLRFVYRVFDVNDGDVLEGEEVRKALRLLGFKVSRKEVRYQVSNLQGANSRKSTINFGGFLEIVARLQKSGYDQHEEILQAFDYIDSDSDGFITQADLCRHASKAGINSSEIKAMIAEADKDDDGKISKEEFLTIMKQTCLFST